MRGAGGHSLYNVSVGGSVDGHLGVPCATFDSAVSGDVNINTQGAVNITSDAGITVHGDKSTQKFTTGHIGMLELEEHVICLSLKGFVGDLKVQEPVTVARKITCATCGKSNSTNVKFCGNCGTNLTYQY